MSENNDFGSFVAGVIVGGLVGSAVALMLAPQSGEETRLMIKDRSIELRDRAYEAGQDARLRAEKALDDAKIRADAAIDELQYRTQEVSRIAKEKLAKTPAEEGAPPEAGGTEIAEEPAA